MKAFQVGAVAENMLKQRNITKVQAYIGLLPTKLSSLMGAQIMGPSPSRNINTFSLAYEVMVSYKPVRKAIGLAVLVAPRCRISIEHLVFR